MKNVGQGLRLLTRLIHARLTGRPLLLSHLVTCRCPCRCETCLWRGLVDEELTAAQIEEVYRDAAKAGILLNAIWGGEPLMREDLPEILRASRKAGLMTILITSGLRFTRQPEELISLLDTVVFSLDHPSGRHDEMRGMPGLFRDVTHAIDRLKRHPASPRFFVNSVISRLNHDSILDLAEWARDSLVPIYFNPIEIGIPGEPTPSPSKQSLAVDESTLADLARSLISLKSRGYPISNSYTYLRTFINGKRPYCCHARKVCIELRPNGDVIDCLDRFHPIANVTHVSLRDLLARPDVRHGRLRNVDCCVCNNADVIDTSYIWSLRPESVFSLLRSSLSPL